MVIESGSLYSPNLYDVLGFEPGCNLTNIEHTSTELTTSTCSG